MFNNGCVLRGRTISCSMGEKAPLYLATTATSNFPTIHAWVQRRIGKRSRKLTSATFEFLLPISSFHEVGVLSNRTQLLLNTIKYLMHGDRTLARQRFGEISRYLSSFDCTGCRDHYPRKLLNRRLLCRPKWHWGWSIHFHEHRKLVHQQQPIVPIQEQNNHSHYRNQ